MKRSTRTPFLLLAAVLLALVVGSNADIAAAEAAAVVPPTTAGVTEPIAAVGVSSLAPILGPAYVPPPESEVSAAAAAEAIKVIAAAAAGVKPLQAGQLQPVLDRHNVYRNRHQAGSLVWDNSIARFAQNYANRCTWGHNPNLGAARLGENLALGHSSFVAAVDAWYNEVRQYNYNRPGFSAATGHFTALVWRSTTRLGCGVARCAKLGNRPLYVCNYSPPGNFINQFRQNVLPPRSNGRHLLDIMAAADVAKPAEVAPAGVLPVAVSAAAGPSVLPPVDADDGPVTPFPGASAGEVAVAAAGVASNAVTAAAAAAVAPTQSGYAINYNQFSCIFLNDRDIFKNVNSKGLVDQHWQWWREAIAAQRFSFGNANEASIFFGNVKHEYGGYLGDMREYCARQNRACPAYNTCNGRGNDFYGRGPLQLTHCYNYRAMGQLLRVDLLTNPMLARSASTNIGWRAAVAFWNGSPFNCMGSWVAGNPPTCPAAARAGNIAAVTRRINPIECGNTPQQTARINRINDVRRRCFGLGIINQRC